MATEVPYTRQGVPHTRQGVSHTRPGLSDTRPRFPDTRPGLPDTRPGLPDTRPRLPDTRPGFPDTRPEASYTRPGASYTRPEASYTRPEARFPRQEARFYELEKNLNSFLEDNCFYLSLYQKKIKSLYRMKTNEQIPQIFHQFQLNENVISAEPFGNGHINDTLKVTNAKGEAVYVLQRINHQIFTNVEMLQNNIRIVTSHIRSKLEARGEQDIDRKVLTFLPTKDGKYYYFDGDSYWRMCLFIPRSQSYEAITPELSYQAGKAFGDFQSMLADIPDGQLGETILNFHNMEFRLQQFHEAIEANAAGRLDEVKPLIDEIEKRATAMCVQEVLYREGKLKKRINHCDTKVNNVMFDEDGKVLCVIDLDTVMPGFVLSDIGDFIRTGANTGAEDDENLDNVNVNMEIFKAYTQGYMETARSFLTPLEISMLPYGGRLLTYMQTVRFLTDYINGDTYYKIHHPKHNLQRTKAQFKLLQSLEEHAPEMENFIKEWI